MTLEQFAETVRLVTVDSPVPVEIHGAVMADDDRVRVRVRVGFEPKAICLGQAQGVPMTAKPCPPSPVPMKAEREPDERLNVAIDIGADDLAEIPAEAGPQFVGETVQELIARAVAEWVARRVSLAGQKLQTRAAIAQSPLAPIVARAVAAGVLAHAGETIAWRGRKMRVANVDQDEGEILLREVRA